jgi:methylated-DNA-[protein]-cysteine S-methyltransferase
MAQLLFTEIPSPVDPLTLVSDGRALTHLEFEHPKWPAGARESWRRDDDLPLFAQARAQLDAYFAGERTAFELPLAPSGTDFQMLVWAQLRRIPYGGTISYAALARAIGDPKATRAVGAANGRNPISIIVPCHRVIGSDGSLTGFGGGIERKKRLLALEAAGAARQVGRLL